MLRAGSKRLARRSALDHDARATGIAPFERTPSALLLHAAILLSRPCGGKNATISARVRPFRSQFAHLTRLDPGGRRPPPCMRREPGGGDALEGSDLTRLCGATRALPSGCRAVRSPRPPARYRNTFIAEPPGARVEGTDRPPPSALLLHAAILLSRPC